jgi:hypothetical protein
MSRDVEPASAVLPLNARRDPEWEYDAIMVAGEIDPVGWVRTACRHSRVVPVTTGQGEDEELVAQLCLTCDAQLPADWRA